MFELAAKPKLKLYRSIKGNLGLEEYLLDMKDQHRKLIARLRCSSSELSIEMDRWKSVSREDRKCLVCNDGSIEYEKHFLLDCPVYNKEREEMFNNIRQGTIRNYDLKMMAHDSGWLMDALIGRNVGEVMDRYVIRYEVGDFLLKAYKLRKESLVCEAKEAS